MSENKIAALASYSSNNNLLDNWYFINPINQRGITSTYNWERWQTGIDRWKRDGETGKSYWRNNRIEHEGDSCLYQIITAPKDTLAGLTLTFSALDSDGRLSTATGVIPATNDVWQVPFGNNDLQFAINKDGLYLPRFYMNNCIAVKLEINDHQTLAHKVGDRWELNEIPNYQLELVKCQRYFRHIYAVTVAYGVDYCFVNYHYPAMYVIPTAQVDGPIYYTDGSYTTSFTYLEADISQDGIMWIRLDGLNATKKVANIRNIYLDTEY